MRCCIVIGALLLALVAPCRCHLGVPASLYQLEYRAATWDDAKQACEERGAKLAVPKTKEQFNEIQKIVRGMYYPNIKGADHKLLAWLGVHNRDDHRLWKSVDGKNIEEYAFHQWAGSNGDSYSDDPKEPHCVVVDAVNPGFRSYWCHKKLTFICESSEPV